MHAKTREFSVQERATIHDNPTTHRRLDLVIKVEPSKRGRTNLRSYLQVINTENEEVVNEVSCSYNLAGVVNESNTNGAINRMNKIVQLVAQFGRPHLNEVKSPALGKCPECGNRELVHEGGMVTCYTCGYSKAKD